MLPEAYYEAACKLFCRMLKRLEAKEQSNGENNPASTAARATGTLMASERETTRARPDPRSTTVSEGLDERSNGEY